jgi:YegS/Rv2252/BmrU family lipid kinase
MTAAGRKAVVILNARAGKFGRSPKAIRALFAGAGMECDVRLTEGPGHAIELARDAVGEGQSYLVAAGGDGTIQEVVNGMMDDRGPRNPAAVLGVLSAGSGSDFIRTFGLARRPSQAIAFLSGDRVVEVDLGRATYTAGGATETRWFANIAEAGIGAEIVRRAERVPRPLGRGRYVAGFGLGLTAFSKTGARIVLDGQPTSAQLTDLIVANAQFFGGGMRIAPGADPADGVFDVLIVKGSKREYVAALAKLYGGRHLPSPAIDEHRARRVEIDADDPLPVEADGEILGSTPAVFEIVPGALRLRV